MALVDDGKQFAAVSVVVIHFWLNDKRAATHGNVEGTSAELRTDSIRVSTRQRTRVVGATTSAVFN